MSGIVGIFNRDGAPVDRDTLQRMTDAMIRRGPDAQRIWSDGPVGLGHAALFTTLEAERENQPATLDGQVWITADARIDEWDHLRRTLVANGRDIPGDVTDVELILHAYHAWGENCVDHLIGDFAFAIWDARQGRMFCARDHMGVKPFYYHLSDRLFAFASDVGALLANPQVPQRINEGRIADYLVGYLEGIDRTSTFYQEIYRFPQAQCRVIDRERHTDRTYWALDPTKEVRLGSDDEYAAAFLEVFTEAVRARLRTPGRVGSMLSGGLDSSSIVGVARNLLREGGHGPLPTFSAVSIDEENIETQIIRAALQMDHLDPHLLRSDELDGLVEEYESLYRETHDLFDTMMPIPQAMYILARRQGLKSVLDGVDGDLVVSLGDHHLTYLIRQGHWWTAVAEAFGISRFYHRWNVSPWSTLAQKGRAAISPASPAWWRALRRPRALRRQAERLREGALVNEDFARKVDLVDRLDRMHSQQTPPRNMREHHARRLDPPFLVVAFERYDRVAAHYSIEPRHPYHDKRVVEYCLGLDWQQKDNRGWTKVVNRRAMGGILPDEVRWSTSRQSLSTEFWNARSAAVRTCAPDYETGDVLDGITPFADVSGVRESYHGDLLACDGYDEFDPWAYYTLTTWLQRRPLNGQ